MFQVHIYKYFETEKTYSVEYQNYSGTFMSVSIDKETKEISRKEAVRSKDGQEVERDEHENIIYLKDEFGWEWKTEFVYDSQGQIFWKGEGGWGVFFEMNHHKNGKKKFEKIELVDKGCYETREFDSHGNEVKFETSGQSKVIRAFDKKNRLIYCATSGCIDETPTIEQLEKLLLAK